MLLVLDSGPLGLLTNPTRQGPAQDAWLWARGRLRTGDRFVVPELADYEVRRELLRADKHQGIQRLDELAAGLGFHALTTAAMRDAAGLWAAARKAGKPTAHDAALDGDVILAAQARELAQTHDAVLVVTSNTQQLERYVEARLWTEI